MKRTGKKGFTIVELVIVIAVIAVLAAVLIPTFSNLIKKANQSADMQTVKNMNTAVQIEYVAGNGPTTFDELCDILTQSNFNLPIQPVSATHKIMWDSLSKKVFLYNTETKMIEFPEDLAQQYPDGSEILDTWYDLATAKTVTGVAFDNPVDTIYKGTTSKLTALLLPNRVATTAQDVTWSSSESDVISINEDGVMTGVTVGTSTITVTTTKGGFTATCNVEVIAVATTNDFKIKLTQSANGEEKVVPYVEEYPYFVLGTTFKLEPQGVSGVTYSYDETKVSIDENGVATCLAQAVPTSIIATDSEGGQSVFEFAIYELGIASPELYHESMSSFTDRSFNMDPQETTHFVVLSNINNKGTLTVSLSDNDASSFTLEELISNDPSRRVFEIKASANSAGQSCTIEVKYMFADGESSQGQVSSSSNYVVSVTNTGINFDSGENFSSGIRAFLGENAINTVERIVFGKITNSTVDTIMVKYGEGDSHFVALTLANMKKRQLINSNTPGDVYWDSTTATLYVVSEGDLQAPTNMNNMFGDAMRGSTAFDNMQEIDLYNFNIQENSTAKGIFAYCKKLERIYVKDATVDWTSYVTSASSAFASCDSLKGCDNEIVDTSYYPAQLYMLATQCTDSNLPSNSYGAFSVRA